VLTPVRLALFLRVRASTSSTLVHALTAVPAQVHARSALSLRADLPDHFLKQTELSLKRQLFFFVKGTPQSGVPCLFYSVFGF